MSFLGPLNQLFRTFSDAGNLFVFHSLIPTTVHWMAKQNGLFMHVMSIG